MFSQKLNRPIALVAAAIVVGGGAYGIVGATAGNGSGTATTASPPQQHQRNPLPAAGDRTLALDRLQGDQSARSPACPSRVSHCRRQLVRR